MPFIDVSFDLKLAYKFKSCGDFVVYCFLTRISLSSLLSTELKMICFQVKMTDYDGDYTHEAPSVTEGGWGIERFQI